MALKAPKFQGAPDRHHDSANADRQVGFVEGLTDRFGCAIRNSTSLNA
jgi:hypothetical protein